jgi:hypothetical protein
MADLENGNLVQHATLGVGRVVAVEPTAVHVFFPGGDRRFAAKLRLPGVLSLLRTDGLERNPWLESLTAFALDGPTGRYALPTHWLSHDEAMAGFLAAYPGGFGGTAYASGKAARAHLWRAAHDAWATAFGDGDPFAPPVDARELGKRALGVERAMAALHPAADAGALKAALSSAEAARPLWTALGELLSVPSPGRARFEKLFAAARGLPVDGGHQWLVATLLPFLAAPERHVLVRPKVTCEAALRLGFDVGDESAPTWSTYAAVRAVYARLLETLAPAGAKDFVDVEAVLHVTAAAKRRARSAR